MSKLGLLCVDKAQKDSITLEQKGHNQGSKHTVTNQSQILFDGDVADFLIFWSIDKSKSNFRTNFDIQLWFSNLPAVTQRAIIEWMAVFNLYLRINQDLKNEVSEFEITKRLFQMRSLH